MKDFFSKHKIALLISLFVGIICILPQLIFINSLGEDYKGIHMFATPNEDAYIAIMQEILDGHPKVASMPFYEYKDKVPLLPSTLFRLYTLPVQLLGISLVNVIVVSKFIYPALLFFLVYLFSFSLFKTGNKNDNKLRILFAVATGILVVFGFDLVDYNSVVSFIKGTSSPQGFLIWTRPINPVSGAILLFFFLFALTRFNYKIQKKWIFWSSIALALMMASYVFSWTIAVVVLGLYSLSFLLKKNWKMLFSYISIFVLGIFFSLPYWINSFRASQMDWYQEATARIGLFHTHTPHFNKFIVAMIVLFLTVSFWAYHKKLIKRNIPEWWKISFILLISSLIVYNQQVITGLEIWYYHYVFYTIPFGYVVFMTLLWHVLRKIYPKITVALVIFVFLCSLSLGAFYQVSAYTNRLHEFIEMQNNQEIFDFFNKEEKDCVVLSVDNNMTRWSNLIPTFTHCNSYYSGENQSVLADPDDFYYRYMSLLRIRGVEGGEIEKYISKNKSEVEHALQYQLQRTLGFQDKKLKERLLKMPEDYKEFVKEDFYSQLSKFRIDYIISEGVLGEKILFLLPSLKEIYNKRGVVIYKFFN